MHRSAIDLVSVLLGGVILGIGLTSRLLRQWLWLSEASVALGIGILVGPFGVGLFDPLQTPSHLPLIREVTRFAIGFQLTATALRLPDEYIRRPPRDLWLLLGLVMPLMWLVGGLLAWAIFGGAFWEALLLGAILMPTDPVLITAVVTGEYAERHLDRTVRLNLSAESGLNDGLAYPLVYLCLFLLTEPSGVALGHFAWRVLLRECLGGVAFGVATGLVLRRLVNLAEAHEIIDKKSFIVFMVAFTLLIFGSSRLLHLEGFLAVFCGAAVYTVGVEGPAHAFRNNIDHILSRVVVVPVFLLFGMVLPWHRWAELGWRGIVFALVLLLARRLPATVALRPLFGRPWRDVLMLGWFGPIGIDSLYFALLAQGAHAGGLWPIVSLVVFASTLLFGFTAVPLTRLYARHPPQ